MQAVSYYIALPFIYLLSLLPFPVLYGVSNVAFFILYHILGYRKRVVWQNLKNAFPEKNDIELKTIEIAFYRYLCDLLLETFKTLTISKTNMIKHCSLDKDAQVLFDQLAQQNKNFMIVMGHYGNWEWAGNTFSILGKHKLYVIYHPLHNPYFDKLIYNMRSRFGTGLIEMKNTFKDMLKHKQQLNATAFIADQTPLPNNAHWTTFLNQQTPVFKGTEMISRKMNYPIVFVNVKRIKRGHYTIFAELLIENPSLTTEGYISNRHTQKLEEEIKKQPEIWLWSHRRWKHKPPANLVQENE